MFIEEIIIDGFKSYASRTQLSGFDSSFNAITGLNGTGKSNILDAICFVLGISELKQVRVSKLQELVYKQGQAGVTKASVTIIFNNQDKERSPVGYEQYSQITVTRTIAIGGRNKYLINGQVAQLNRVQNLFHSVQLNVNNPHFLIMQGRITKVLNMKPPEILSLIEEAAGTRMFETKKQTALKTIEKKESKLKEIDNILKEEITPTLEKLEKQRASFLTWSQNNSECETLSRFCTAHKYWEREKLLLNGEEDLKKIKDEIDEQKEQIHSSISSVETIEKKISKLKQKSKDNNEFKDLDKKVNELSKLLVKQNSVYQHKKEEVQTERDNLHSIQESIKELQQSIKKAIDLEKKSSEEFSSKKKESDELNLMFKNLTNQLHSLQAGIASSGSGKTLTEQLIEFKKISTDAGTAVQQAILKINHLNNELKEKKKKINQMDTESDQLQKKQKKLEEEIKKFEQDMKNSKFDEKLYQEKLAEKENVQNKISELKEEISKISPKLAKYLFSYKDPEKNFDRNKVKGRVANLFTLKDSQNVTALEVTAGAKLYNVIVEDEISAKKLIEKGTSERITVIPLNKISYEKVPEKTIEKAKEISKGSANLALQLIEFNPDLKKAMEYVFGQTFICKDIDIAEKVAFHKDIKKKSVSIKGDSFDPSGTLTGGSRSTTESLNELVTLNEKKKQLEELEKKLENILKKIEEMNKQKNEYFKLKQEFELKTHELSILNSRIKDSKHNQLIEECNQLEYDIKMEEENKIKNEELKNEKETSCKQIEKDMKNFTNSKDVLIKQLERDIEITKKKQIKAKEECKNKEIENEKLKAEIENLQNEMIDLEKQAQTKKESIETLNEEFKKVEKQAQSKKNEYETLKKELDEKKTSISELDDEIDQLNREKDSLMKQKSECQVKIKKLELKYERDVKEISEAKNLIEGLLKENSWIKTEKKYFNKPGTDFDFSARDPKDVYKKYNEILNQQQKLGKTINKKVLSMFEKAQQEYKELIDKKKKVETDKSKIEQVIKEVDEKKNEAIEKTWKKVNGDFGSIFSTLLPGTNSKLEPLEGKSVMDGLEVKVAFGNVWKDSLTELSGGQRSLLALSLILSLLLFKPAPMYILDEIDAALDPSHTQNIGRMLKNHFSNSQFIIVSLKEGMFSNANVIFKTQFINGQSAVIRTITEHKKDEKKKIDDEEIIEKEEEEEETVQKGKKRKRKKD